MQNRPFAAVLTTSLLLISGCAAFQSEAYQVGYNVGDEFRKIKKTADVLDTWSDNPGQGKEITSADVYEYCKASWQLVGFTSGLENTAENKLDFVDGCVAGSGF